LKVLVLEQHDKVGGCTTNFERGDFTFEASLHAMAGGGPGKNNRGLYKLLEITGVGQKVELIELPHFYRSVYPGIDMTLPNNWEGFKRVLKQKWPEEAEGVDRFHELCSSLMDDLLSLKYMFRHSGLKQFFVKAMVPIRQRTLFKWKDKTFKDLMDHCFKNEDIKAVVSQLWVYYGAPVPEQTALISMAATEAYLGDGIWHIKGTSQALSDAYAERIRELGGEIKTETLVTKITIKDGVAKGVQTESGDTYSARYVVANTDPYQLTYKLIGENHYPDDYLEKLKRLKPANSLYGVYLGLNIDLKKLGYHDTEIFYNTSKDSTVVYENMMKGDFQNGIVAVTIYSNYNDPIYAPPGKSVVVLNAYSSIDTWPEYQSDAYYEMKDKMEEELITLAAKMIPELANPDNIEERDAFTPHTIKRYTMNRGGIVYGFYLSPDQWQKIPNHTPVDNVFIASNWSQAWHGVGSAQVNGWRAARLIMDREGIE
ncbi:MAG: NAD(P)/FAD-dependent oxidoreductase, partial [Deltaproteobacteria bacterium]|nr:NAD(P)/FAD-dependent oxidoreductase [Deltaproteobacteria bacterium]